MGQDNGMDTSPSWTELYQALDDLQAREAHYRKMHDHYGADHLATGQAWDRLRRSGHQARLLIHAHQQRQLEESAHA